ncbi:hypothetical protein ACVIYH_009122 [Bradyrhizobium diazoefficiens]
MAGLLDYLYDASTYGGNGGLLSRLAPSLGSIPQSQGFPQQDQAAQAAPLQIGGYQMPRIGNADQFQPQQAMTPPNAMPTQGQMQPQMAPQQMPQELPPALGGISRLGRMFSPNGLIARMTGNDSQSIAQQNLKAQYDATRQLLQQNGLSPQEASSRAMMAVMNPEAGKTILTEALTNKEKYGVVSENPIEGKKYGFINERDQTIDGKPIGASTGQTSASLLAPGVSGYNPNLSGDAYLGQFSPEVQAAVKAYINGDVLPSGNPRQQGIASQAKTIAQKYGADMGIPVSDATYAEKRKYRTELGTNSPNSAGGQAKAFNQGISHLSALADTLEKLDNSNGFGIPAVAGVVNSVRQGTSTTQSAISDEAKTLGQTVAGEVGKLFSGSAGGGVHERELTRERFDTVKSKPQLAAALKATIETMQGGLQALEQRRDAVLGPNSGVELVNQETREKIAKIQGVIDRLEGKGGASQAGGIQEGATATNPQTGQKITFRNGKWQ